MTTAQILRCFLVFLGIGSLALSALGGHAAERIYKTVDADGNVVFTDVPPKEGERSQAVDVQSTNTFDETAGMPAAESQPTQTWRTDAAPEENSDDDADAAPRYQYTTFMIVSPEDDAPVRENAGNVTVVVAVEPSLRTDDNVRVLLDGQPEQEGHQLSFELTNVDRGTHAVAAEVVNKQGQVIQASQAVTFHLLRAVAPRPSPSS